MEIQNSKIHDSEIHDSEIHDPEIPDSEIPDSEILDSEIEDTTQLIKDLDEIEANNLDKENVSKVTTTVNATTGATMVYADLV